MSRMLKVEHVFPPISIRTCDYCAYIDGEEESGRCGWGATEQEAIDSWNDLYGEDDVPTKPEVK